MSGARSTIGTKWRAAMFARALMIGGLALAASAPLACSSEDGGCDGSVDSQGRCETTCKPELCPVAGSACFDNACAAPCPLGDTKTECALGSRCETLDLGNGVVGNFCAIYPFGKDGKTGQGDPCTSDAQCDVKRGYTCVDGICANNDKQYEPCTTTSECDEVNGYQCVDGECRAVGCSQHQDCAKIGECAPGQNDSGQTVLACVKTNKQPPGQFHTPCPLVAAPPSCASDAECDAATQICAKDADGVGRCLNKCTAEDKQLCAPSESCVADSEGRTACSECDFANGFVCLGAGTGDIDAYCSKAGCQADSDCGSGFYCATVRTGRVPCQTACGITGQPTSATCIPPEDIGAGKEYSCGPLSMLRNLCMKREFCNECETDADCLAVPNQLCSEDSGGRKICTSLCDPNTNSCPWGNAATCGDWNNDGVFTCSHRFETGCVGTGKSCHPCLDDADCPGGLCLQSDFTQERYCVDLGADCTCHPCSADTDCPNGQCEGRCTGLGSKACVTDAECANTCAPPSPNGKRYCNGTNVECADDVDCTKCVKGAYYCKGSVVEQNAVCRSGSLPNGCPSTPGGLTMTCYGGNAIQSGGSPLYNKCVGANVNPSPTASPQTGCWPN